MTGLELYGIFKRKTNSSYSQALSTTQQSAILNEGLIKVVEDIYRNGKSDYQTDQVRAIISTEYPVTVAANKVDLTDIANFNHFLTIRYTIQDNTFKATLTNILLNSGTSTRIILSRPSSLRSEEQITLTNSVCDGTYYVKQLNETVYELYTDEALLTPFYNGVPYNNVGTIKRVIKTYATEEPSSEKISVLNESTIYYPKYQLADNFIKLYAGTSTIISAELDYITTLPLMIDVTDIADDLLVYYPQELLYSAMDKAAYLFGTETGYIQLAQAENIEIQSNKQVIQ